VKVRFAETGSRKYHVDDAGAVACRLTFKVLTWGIRGSNVSQKETYPTVVFEK